MLPSLWGSSKLVAKAAAKAAEAEAEFVGAAGKGDLPTLQRLFKSDKELVNAKDKDGRSALIHAAYNGRLEAVVFLLKGGADVDARDKTKQSPLHRAASQGRVDGRGLSRAHNRPLTISRTHTRCIRPQLSCFISYHH